MSASSLGPVAGSGSRARLVPAGCSRLETPTPSRRTGASRSKASNSPSAASLTALRLAVGSGSVRERVKVRNGARRIFSVTVRPRIALLAEVLGDGPRHRVDGVAHHLGIGLVAVEGALAALRLALPLDRNRARAVAVRAAAQPAAVFGAEQRREPLLVGAGEVGHGPQARAVRAAPRSSARRPGGSAPAGRRSPRGSARGAARRGRRACRGRRRSWRSACSGRGRSSTSARSAPAPRA